MTYSEITDAIARLDTAGNTASCVCKVLLAVYRYVYYSHTKNNYDLRGYDTIHRKDYDVVTCLKQTKFTIS